jgi:hypothetical protein
VSARPGRTVQTSKNTIHTPRGQGDFSLKPADSTGGQKVARRVYISAESSGRPPRNAFGTARDERAD